MRWATLDGWMAVRSRETERKGDDTGPEPPGSWLSLLPPFPSFLLRAIIAGGRAGAPRLGRDWTDVTDYRFLRRAAVGEVKD